MHYIIGIDEAGRGPWAGPVVAGGWMAVADDAPGLFSSLEGLTDSKLLSEKRREKYFLAIECMQYKNECQFSFAYRDAYEIDQIGIREANRQCMQDVTLSLLQFIRDTDTVDIFIDGCDNYRFDIGKMDIEYCFARKGRLRENCIDTRSDAHVRIQYHIAGDVSIRAISAASIIAKVTRDRIMDDFHEEFPDYGFDKHKGYGTSKHRQSILNYGITPIHRKTYAPMKTLISSSSSL